MATKAKSPDINQPIEFARLLTNLEDAGPFALLDRPELQNIPTAAFRIGITGPPGAGKSTLVNRLITDARKKDLKVGVLAVDPSSPFTQGAVLGDRVRYQEHGLDERVFIRSIGSRGAQGGLHSSVWLMVRAFDLAGFDILIIETVGVGQTELQIMNVADHISLVLVPESGDGIQGMKAGILEIADVYVINKSDRPGADVFAGELRTALEVSGEKVENIYQVSALNGSGLENYLNEIWSVYSVTDWKKARAEARRYQAEVLALSQEACWRWLSARIPVAKDEKSLLEALARIQTSLK